jgi:hypothetical protein
VKPGDEVRVKVIERISDTRALVVDVENGNPGILLIKGQLRVRSDGTVNAWLVQFNRREGTYTYGNAYFGKFSISRSLADRYVLILRKLYDNPQALVADDISCLKGMANRCLKKDQWDWFTTYKYLGYPVHPVLRKFVADAKVQRDLLRQGRYDGLPGFRGAHHNLLSSILFHLSEAVEVDDEDVDVPVPDLDHDLWARLSFESRKNIKMAERIHAKSSLYTLMHYFVVLEQEFRNHFVQPFADLYGNEFLQMRCLQQRYKRTHDLLTGKGHFTLGTVHFLGEFVVCRRACEGSEAIQKFSDFLSKRKGEFVVVCSLIATEPIGGFPLPQLRNALAHGDASVISSLDGATFDGVRSLLFEPPRQVIRRILSNSMRYSEEAIKVPNKALQQTAAALPVSGGS